MKNEDDIFADLVGILRNFEGREYSGEITRQTLFFSDLGFASIDAVVLGEKLQTLYGQPIPFPEFLRSLADRKAEDIQVGELALFLSRIPD